ncbi:DUF4169 family protein [Aliiroseovarius sp. YM-037]|uniref:DUF4169 family protein n=1 Tax=Aliiroseovarius sp. YM-037 TaxID=3341728 RepID=UPI003A7F7435
MSQPINLNRARKDRARQAARVRAEENAIKFGRTKEQRAQEKSEADKARRHIEDHRRDE